MSGKIVFINQATGYLTIDIINEFIKEYDEVVLITGSIRVQDIHPDRRVKVDYITRYNRGSNIRKLSSWLIGTLQIYYLLSVKYRKYEKFYISIPPSSYLMSNIFSADYAILLFDLYPEALRSFGIRDSNPLFRWWSRRNRKAFSRSKRVFTLSGKMKGELLKFCEPEKVSVIPNWSAFSGLQPIGKEENRLLSLHGLRGKFVVQYSGNIGHTHRVETVVELAEQLKYSSDIVFMIIGRGERVNVISSMIRDKNLDNCLLLPFRPDDELFESLCAADLAVVTLDDRTPDISVPSKIYNILAAGLPVMSIAAENSGISLLLREHEAGVNFDKSDLAGMRAYIEKLKSDTAYRSRLSANSLSASLVYTRANARQYLELYRNNN
ncbi:MAG TPA: glycosyltransferase family 4 protein [Bacteroidales bacterium]|jgi:glycosyltransferase involved in cell wall biosynthesis|nr:glycosyltransferase family 4 protein [Bacteroidales bacterium]HPJ60193.1 glycosyltransferase family 4 protein [Bacteroidales bacterium]HPR13105.1 glycosyltransferase family 4 protein [Bacteroidales bacterium]